MQGRTTNPVRRDDLAAWSRQAVNEKLDLKNDAQQRTHPRMDKHSYSIPLVAKNGQSRAHHMESICSIIFPSAD